MIRSTVARVDLEALKHNFRAIHEFLAMDGGSASGGIRPTDSLPQVGRVPQRGPNVSGTAGRVPRSGPAIIAVVKANAYGHGAAAVGPALEQAGATMLACADIEEGIVLRQAGVTVPILVFGALSVSDLDGLFEYSLTPTISTPGAAKAVQAAAATRNATIEYHLKIDTGMNRLGFRHDNLRRTLPDLLASPNLRLEAVYTHFASADVPESPAFNLQREHFDAALATVDDLLCHSDAAASVARTLSGQPSDGSGSSAESDGRAGAAQRTRRYLRHAANSAATLRDSRVWYDIVRPGLLLYGIVPPPLASTIDLRPVMSLTSRVVAVKGLRPGEGVGYGWRFTTDRPRTIAVVPAGYADGLDTRLSGRGHVLIRGKRVPIVGAVSMDMITVDVTDAGDVAPGDEVVILGSQGDESWQQIDARELASSVGMIPWEVLCRLGSRIERTYQES